MRAPPITGLPVEAVLPELCRVLAAGTAAVLEAPPGAGKTTLVPLHLLAQSWLEDRKILMLEPRRLAARAAAMRMADLLGEPVGQTVGYAMRFERRIGPATRIEVVTEGLLTRYLQRDPALAAYGAVLFDEFHERSLDADLGLALCLEVQESLRPDLRLLAMSATLDGAALAAHLGDAPVLRSDGRLFPVRVEHLGSDREEPLELRTARAVELALGMVPGSVLVFLPGAREIRRTADLLAARQPDLPVFPLYGDLPAAAQAAAIRPSGRRRVVLATNIAETSLTIEGVAAVVDSGLERRQRFSARTGMSRLVSLPIARSSAEQRRGRAGRLGPGVCLRLWSAEEERGRLAQRPPEILEADLAPLALELAVWGVRDPTGLRFPTPPPAGPFAAARSLLVDLGALDADSQVTGHGRAMADLPLHPRLAHMLLTARAHGLAATALAVAALLSSRAATRAGTDLAGQLAELGRDEVRRVRQQVARLLGEVGGETRADEVGAVLSLAFPERVAQARAGSRGGFRLANGRGAVIDPADPLAREPWLAVAELEDAGAEARIRLAAAMPVGAIDDLHHHRLTVAETVGFDQRQEAVVARRERRFGALVLKAQDLEPDPGRIAGALCEGIRWRGLDCLPWTESARQLQARVRLLRARELDAWPDLSDAGLRDRLDEWLGPYLGRRRRLAALADLDLAAILQDQLDHRQRRELARRAPERLTVPSGRQQAIDYATDPPVLAVKLQELFGLTATPSVDDGRVPLVLHLLSPAGRPLAVTGDLAGFWSSGYPAVRRELRGRYPKHPWPEDPLLAQPTHRTARSAGQRS